MDYSERPEPVGNYIAGFFPTSAPCPGRDSLAIASAPGDGESETFSALVMDLSMCAIESLLFCLAWAYVWTFFCIGYCLLFFVGAFFEPACCGGVLVITT